MKVNRIKRSRSHMTLAIFALVVVVAIIVGIVLGFNTLKAIYLERCIVTDMSEQVIINSGKLVKPDIIAENMGLKKGVNLALLDFKRKREELLRRIPNLRSVTITRQLPDKVFITCEEREPIARLGVHGRKTETGKVVDYEGVVFFCQRGTRMLPIIRESPTRLTAPGMQLSGRARAALRILDACRTGELQELGILDADTSYSDYILCTLGDSYSQAKIAWEEMDEDTPATKASLERQLTMLLKAVRASVGARVVIWNATDTSHPGRIYADTKGNMK